MPQELELIGHVATRTSEDEEAHLAHQVSYLEPSLLTDPDQLTQARCSHEMSLLRTQMPHRHRQICEMFFKGHPRKEIIGQLKTSQHTINLAINSAQGLRLMSLYTQLDDIRNGPSLTARRNMAWRIAQRAEHHQPNTAIRAIDMLNKQSGDYKPDVDEAQSAGLTVNIQNFQVSVTRDPQQYPDPPPLKDVTPGKFQPITINTTDPTEDDPSER